MNGRQGAVQRYGRPQFLQGQIGFLGQQRPHLALMRGQDRRFAPRIMMAWGDVAGASALLEEFLDHPQGHSVAHGNFVAGALLMIVGGQDSFAQIWASAKPPYTGSCTEDS